MSPSLTVLWSRLGHMMVRDLTIDFCRDENGMSGKRNVEFQKRICVSYAAVSISIFTFFYYFCSTIKKPIPVFTGYIPVKYSLRPETRNIQGILCGCDIS